jgi:enoyl-CoA hydratase/carnithine racemase
MAQAITITTRSDGVAVLTFDQPGSRANVLTGELWTEFGEALAALASRTDLKGLVLASAKPGIFIAGADLKLLQSAPGPNDPAVRGFIEQGLRVLEQLEALPFPTCAAIDGAALGGGLEVALACDYRICGTNSKVQLGLPEVKLGLIPGWGGTQRLPRVTSLKMAGEMLTSGESMPMYRAKQLSQFISDVLDSTAFIEEVVKWFHHNHDVRAHMEQTPGSLQMIRWRLKAHDIIPTEQTRMPAIPDQPLAAREAIQVMLEGTRLPLYDGIKLETEAFMRLAGSDESKRLIAEFFASRKK